MIYVLLKFVIFIIGGSCGMGVVIVWLVVECGYDVVFSYLCDVVVVDLVVVDIV